MVNRNRKILINTRKTERRERIEKAKCRCFFLIVDEVFFTVDKKVCNVDEFFKMWMKIFQLCKKNYPNSNEEKRKKA